MNPLRIIKPDGTAETVIEQLKNIGIRFNGNQHQEELAHSIIKANLDALRDARNPHASRLPDCISTIDGLLFCDCGFVPSDTAEARRHVAIAHARGM